LPVAYSITSSARAKIDCGIFKPSDSAGLKVVGDFGGEGANASGLVDDYRAGTEWFPRAKSQSALCRLPTVAGSRAPLHVKRLSAGWTMRCASRFPWAIAQVAAVS
jgi:hypothetical protein